MLLFKTTTSILDVKKIIVFLCTTTDYSIDINGTDDVNKEAEWQLNRYSGTAVCLLFNLNSCLQANEEQCKIISNLLCSERLDTVAGRV